MNSGSYLLKKIAFQETHEAPLVQRDYYTDPSSYYSSALGLLSIYDIGHKTHFVDTLPQDFRKDIGGNMESIAFSGIVGMAMVNVTKLGLHMDDLERQGRFLAEFYQATGGLCGFIDHTPKGSDKKEQLLVFHPVQYDDLQNIRRYDEKMAGKFFGFLLNKNILTMEQVDRSELHLGTLYHHILDEKNEMLKNTMRPALRKHHKRRKSPRILSNP